MAFRIHFSGLIAHLRVGGLWRIVTLDADAHHSTLIVHDSHLARPAVGFADDPKNGYHRFLIDDRRLMTNLPTGIPTKGATFDQMVPKLSRVLDQPVDIAAHNGNVSHQGVNASMVLGAGDIAPDGCFRKKVRWTGSGEPLPECVAYAIRYTAKFPDDAEYEVEIIDAATPTDSIRFTTDAEVWIVNSAPGGRHFHMYNRLATGSTAREPREIPGEFCEGCDDDFDIPTMLHALDVEVDHDHHSDTRAKDRPTLSNNLILPDFDCSNSQYP
jgi:hypothetical protein